MQLDKTQIVIRERGWLEILDLALRVIRSHGKALFLTSLAGSAPLGLFNYWLLRSLFRSHNPDAAAGYLWCLTLLVLIEIPLAAAPTTLYLGQALFLNKPSPRQIARDLLSCSPQLIFLQVAPRIILVPFVITWIFPFAVWPFLNEIILLERNPLRARGRGEITTRKRSSALHAGSSSEFLARAVGEAFISLWLVVGFWLTIWNLVGIVSGYWDFDGWVYTIGFPIAMWLAVAYFTVARYLGYLDMRIRHEGWEIDLLLRAEAARISRQVI